MKIVSSDISVVIQGALSFGTKAVLKSLRTALPGAELILSTWEGTEVDGLDFDKVVLSPDPGAQIADEVSGIMNNVNRQIVSSAAGLKVVSKPFVLKTRTDIIINSAEFLAYFGKYDNKTPYIFKNCLLICNYYTRNPRAMEICVHPSDWLLFGNAEDVRLYYSHIPLQTDQDAEWFRFRKKSKTLFTNYLSRFTPEQYIFIFFLRQFQTVPIDCYYDFDHTLMHLTEELFAKCFVILDYQNQLDIHFIKYDPNRYLEKQSLLSHKQWLVIYRHYCARNISLCWWCYCISNWAARFSFFARKAVVKALDAIGLKETVKSLLQGKIGQHRFREENKR